MKVFLISLYKFGKVIGWKMQDHRSIFFMEFQELTSYHHPLVREVVVPASLFVDLPWTLAIPLEQNWEWVEKSVSFSKSVCAMYLFSMNLAGYTAMFVLQTVDGSIYQYQAKNDWSKTKYVIMKPHLWNINSWNF